ncbi:ABC transporter ATP-binding protein [Pseudoalteromonas sp. Of7M-16]|uniref:ATP-binding cassette domain-containing protein n=1 Tax=Pseudoalteromonas sp. Of7M-16 TaxID=2917756 RepID=UPI001EF66369|nr:ABC transporter ATP-binding protein [Pseudoalteromonas sp. Of7M-16]MCG7550740.1 ABC transporter ATP-binding protein/permease [Pseudoalteromonas sp. Of7M-16]
MRVEPYSVEESINPWSVFVSFLATCKGKVTLVLSLATSISLIELMSVYLLFLSIQALLLPSTSSVEQLTWIVVGLVGAILIKSALGMAAYYFSHQIALNALTELRLMLVNRFAALSQKCLSQHQPEELKYLLTEDMKKLEVVISRHSVELLQAVISSLTIVIVLYFIDWRLALSIVAVASMALLVSRLFMSKMASYQAKAKGAEEGLNSALIDYVKYAPLAKTHGLDSQYFTTLSNKAANYNDAALCFVEQEVRNRALCSALLGSSFIFMLPTAIWLHSVELLTLELVVLSILLVMSMVAPILSIYYLLQKFSGLQDSIQRIMPWYVNQYSSRKSAPQAIDLKYPQLQFYHVGFNYKQHSILSNVHFELRPNTINVVFAGAGSGKSTLAMLASGLISPSSGRVQLYGKDVSELSDSERANDMGVVTQACYLFEGSVRDNILLGRSGVSTAALEHAIVASQLKPWLQQQTSGLETQLQAQGKNLSCREKIRIAIARALISAPPLVIIDDADLAMDNQTHAKFYQTLKGHYPNTTFLVFTCTYLGLENGQQINVLRNGEVISQGTHEALLARCDHYAKGWQLQRKEDATTVSTSHTPLESFEH